MGKRRQDPVAENADRSVDLYEISDWEVRSRFDRAVNWLYYAGQRALRVAVVLTAIAILGIQLAFGSLGVLGIQPLFAVLAVLSAMVGFLFAAPGAVVHRGRITPKENGLIALAGPVTNLVLAGAFFAMFLVAPGDGVLTTVGSLGVWINAFLAGFNMIPFGPLDGATVKDWDLGVFAVSFLVMGGLAAAVLFTDVVPLAF